MLVPTNKSRDKLKECEKHGGKLQNIFKSINNKSDDYDEKCTKIKFNSDDDLPLNKTLELYNIIIEINLINKSRD